MFDAYFMDPNAPPKQSRAAKQLFAEALSLYLKAMREHNMLNSEVKDLLLTAVAGLTRLGSYPLARALIRLSFSELTADETLLWIERARQSQRLNECD